MKSRINLLLASIKNRQNPSELFTWLALRRELQGCDSVLDVGCGASPTMRNLGAPHLTGVDAYAPSIEKARQIRSHDELVLGDVRNLLAHFKPKSHDVCVALDVIEHLPKEQGFKLMTEMETIARKKVIFLTPSGFLSQGNTEADDYQRHYSGWEASEMRKHGYQVYGLLGPKAWRGEYHRIKRKPAPFWALASLLAHVVWTHARPEKSAAILCVKTLSP